MSNSLDPDQDLHSVSPDLGPNCLERLSADDKSCSWQGKSYGKLLCPVTAFIECVCSVFSFRDYAKAHLPNTQLSSAI